MRYADMGPVVVALLAVDPASVNTLVACINIAGSLGIAVGMFALHRRTAWREDVERRLALLFNKFRALKDRHGLDTTIRDDD